MKQKIFAANSELDKDKEYQSIVQINKHNIIDKVLDRKVYMTINKELTANVTYQDLKDLIVQALDKHKKVI